MAYPKFDPSTWNLTLTVGVLVTAATTGCGPKVPFETDTDSGDSTSGDSFGPTSGPDPTNTTVDPPQPTTTSDTDTSAECFSDDDCPYYYFCYNNRCYYDGYCADGCCSGGCYYDCYQHEDCGPEAYCYYGSCNFPPEPEPCPDIAPTPIPLPDTASGGALSLAFVDADGNAEDELVQGRAGTFEVDFVGTQALTFQLGASTVSSIGVGEFTGDDIVDLVVGDQPAAALLVLRGVGNGAFSFQAITREVPVDHPVVVGRFDAGATADVVSALEGEVAFIHRGLGDGTFAPGEAILEAPFSLASADFDADGASDLLIHSFQWTDLWFGGSSFPGEVTSAPDVAGTSSRILATGDFNGDGIPDAAGISPSGLLTLWEGNGAGLRWPARYVSTLPGLDRVAVGDIDGDGSDDLLATSAATETLFVFRGGSNSQLVQCSSAVGLAHPATALAAGDVDGDGKDEVAYANDGSTTLWSLVP